MKPDGEVELLRIFVGRTNRWHDTLVYEAIKRNAHELHLASATILRGPRGFGKRRRPYRTKFPRFFGDVPILLKLVDIEGRVKSCCRASARPPSKAWRRWREST